MEFVTLFETQRNWSYDTFGDAGFRGPQSSLLHLKDEVDEMLAAPDDPEEYADGMILLMDAAWRAGFTAEELLVAVQYKTVKNKHRKWPSKDQQHPDKPTGHVK